MISYEYRCNTCREQVLTDSMYDDQKPCHQFSVSDCKGHLIRQYSFGLGAVQGAGGSPSRSSQ